MANGEKLKNLLLKYRILEHHFNLEDYTNTELKKLQRSLDKGRRNLLSEIDAADFRIQAGRERQMLEKLNDMTFAIQVKLHKDIEKAVSKAGENSYKAYNDILSFHGILADTIGFNFVSLSPAQLKAMVSKVPVGGNLLKHWVKKSFEKHIIEDINEVIMADNLTGLSTSKTIDKMQESFGMIKKDAENFTRTYISSINNKAAEDVYAANNDIIKTETWSATFEVSMHGSGTCLRCAVLDGEKFALNEPHIRPPLHLRCRCFMLADTISYKELGLNIPEMKKGLRPFTERGANRKIIKAGRFDGTFEAFLNTRSVKYQKDLLGVNRYRLLREGKIKFHDMVDKDGNIILLKKNKNKEYVGLAND